MDFKEIVRTDSIETGAIQLSITVSKETLRIVLKDFYETAAKYCGKEPDAPWDEIDDAAEQAMAPGQYREMRRDYAVSIIVGEALSSLGITPELTPSIHALGYPDIHDDYSFELSVVEKPVLTLSSCEPVEIHTEDISVSNELIDNRISLLLESRVHYKRVEDHAVAPGDCIRVDIATMSEGKTVPHLTGKMMVLELADGSMPDGFVDQLVGVCVGETRTVDYSVKRPRAIADDDVDVYTATVTVIEQLRKDVPLLTEDWVGANIGQVSSVDEFRSGVAQGLAVEVAAVNRDTHARLANIALEKRLQGAIPDAFYQASRNGLMDKLERELAEKGQTLDNYYEQERMNEEELSVQMLIRSAENLRQGFALEALFEGREMEISDTDLERACEQAFGRDSYDLNELRQSGKHRLVESAAKRIVALKWLVDTAIVKS